LNVACRIHRPALRRSFPGLNPSGPALRRHQHAPRPALRLGHQARSYVPRRRSSNAHPPRPASAGTGITLITPRLRSNVLSLARPTSSIDRSNQLPAVLPLIQPPTDLRAALVAVTSVRLAEVEPSPAGSHPAKSEFATRELDRLNRLQPRNLPPCPSSVTSAPCSGLLAQQPRGHRASQGRSACSVRRHRHRGRRCRCICRLGCRGAFALRALRSLTLRLAGISSAPMQQQAAKDRS